MKKLILYLIVMVMAVTPAQIFAEEDTLSDDVYVIEHLGIAAGIGENQSDGISRAEFLSWVLKTARVELLAVSKRIEHICPVQKALIMTRQELDLLRVISV